MGDLKNKIYKIMWANQEEIIWDVFTEKPVLLDNKIYDVLNKFVDIKKWKVDYSKAYFEWINEDNSNIYDIYFELNTRIIEVLPTLNDYLKGSNIQVFYWFDVDRDKSLNFEWEFCPITGAKLISPFKDRKILVSSKVFLLLEGS